MLPPPPVQFISITPRVLGHMHPSDVTELLCVVGLGFPPTFKFLCTFLFSQDIHTKIFVVIFVLVCMYS